MRLERDLVSLDLIDDLQCVRMGDDLCREDGLGRSSLTRLLAHH